MPGSPPLSDSLANRPRPASTAFGMSMNGGAFAPLSEEEDGDAGYGTSSQAVASSSPDLSPPSMNKMPSLKGSPTKVPQKSFQRTLPVALKWAADLFKRKNLNAEAFFQQTLLVQLIDEYRLDKSSKDYIVKTIGLGDEYQPQFRSFLFAKLTHVEGLDFSAVLLKNSYRGAYNFFNEVSTRLLVAHKVKQAYWPEIYKMCQLYLTYQTVLNPYLNILENKFPEVSRALKLQGFRDLNNMITLKEKAEAHIRTAALGRSKSEFDSMLRVLSGPESVGFIGELQTLYMQKQAARARLLNSSGAIFHHSTTGTLFGGSVREVSESRALNARMPPSWR